MKSYKNVIANDLNRMEDFSPQGNEEPKAQKTMVNDFVHSNQNFVEVKQMIEETQKQGNQ